MEQSSLDLRARAPTPPWAVCVRFRGLEQLRQRLQGGAPLLVSTSSAELSGTLWIADLGDLQLTGGVLDAPAFCAGFCPPDVLSATVVLAAPDGGTINRAPLEARGLLLFPPGGLYEGWSPAGYRWVSAFVTKPQAEKLMLGTETPLPRLSESDVLRARLSPADIAALEACSADLALTRRRATPTPLPTEGAGQLAALWRRLLVRGWSGAVPVVPTTARRRSEALLRKAGRYLHAHLAEPVYMADLVRATGAPERTLEHAFRRRMGLSPMAYLAWLRMAAARRQLTARRPQRPASVTDTAHAVGINHLGRFAAAYRRTFGETPQATVLAHGGRRRATRTTMTPPAAAFEPV